MPAPGIAAIEAWPGVYHIRAPFDRLLNDWIKNGDGNRARWHFDHGPSWGKVKAWYLPKERLEDLRAYATERRWPLHITTTPGMYAPEALDLPDDLTSWQRQGVLRALGDRVLLAQWITGAGKSRFAIEVYRASQRGSAAPVRALIVCPKVVLRTWEMEQLPRWLPYGADADQYASGPPWWALLAGRKTDRPQPEITLCSYGSLHKIPQAWGFDLIIFDELHYGIHGGSKRSGECLRLSVGNPSAIRIGLTATPTSASLTDLWSQLQILCPGRWGSYHKWWRRYFVQESVGFEDHVRPGPLKAHRQPELVEQLNSVCHYVSHEDVGDALPPVSWHQADLGGLRASRLSAPANIRAWRAEQLAHGGTRAKEFVDAARRESVKLADKPTAIVVYHRELAAAVTYGLAPLPQLRNKVVAQVSGELSPKQRHEILAGADVAIVTMRSVTEGLDLQRYTRVYLLEAYPVPLYLTQVLGRFVRLFAKDPVEIHVCRLRGSSDDVISTRLLTRMAEQGRLLRQGKVEQGLGALLSVDVDSDAFLEEIRAACAELGEGDPDQWESEYDCDGGWDA